MSEYLCMNGGPLSKREDKKQMRDERGDTHRHTRTRKRAMAEGETGRRGVGGKPRACSC